MLGFKVDTGNAESPVCGRSTMQNTADSTHAEAFGSFRKLGVPYYGVLMIRILLFSVIY